MKKFQPEMGESDLREIRRQKGTKMMKKGDAANIPERG